jgi:hypothetical protein
VTAADAAAPGAIAVAVHEVRKRALRSVKRALRPLWMRRLDARNRIAGAPLLSPQGPVVSLTTYEPRWHNVHYTIESIGAGTLRPSRLVLWVAPSVLTLGMPDALQRQIERGLELRTCEDLGPHKKYHPLVAGGPLGKPMVTADDDVLYGADWLEGLVAAAARRPDCIHAHRAHVMSFDEAGRFLPYAQWPACRSTLPSALHFTTGVGGVLFPLSMQEALRRAGDGFRACCPRADDIWLNAVAWRAGILVRQTQAFSPLLFEIPGTRSHGLAQGNRESGGNDQQLMQTYTADERAQLFALARSA